MEGRLLRLGNLVNLAIELRSGGLVEAHCFLKTRCTEGIQQPQRSKTIHIARVLGHIKGNFDMTHRSKVIDLICGASEKKTGKIRSWQHALVTLPMRCAATPRAAPLESTACLPVGLALPGLTSATILNRQAESLKSP
jgi:hypothetical protein